MKRRVIVREDVDSRTIATIVILLILIMIVGQMAVLNEIDNKTKELSPKNNTKDGTPVFSGYICESITVCNCYGISQGVQTNFSVDASGLYGENTNPEREIKCIFPYYKMFPLGQGVHPEKNDSMVCDIETKTECKVVT